MVRAKIGVSLDYRGLKEYKVAQEKNFAQSWISLGKLSREDFKMEADSETHQRVEAGAVWKRLGIFSAKEQCVPNSRRQNAAHFGEEQGAQYGWITNSSKVLKTGWRCVILDLIINVWDRRKSVEIIWMSE